MDVIRIPALGTTAREIFLFLDAGYKPSKFAKELNMSKDCIHATVWRMRHPNKGNEYTKIGKRNKRSKECSVAWV